MPEIAVTILPDGSIMVPRGTPAENEIFLTIFKRILDDDSYSSLIDFFNISDSSEMIFGPPGLCG